MTAAAWITVLATVLVGSTGSGGAVYWLLNRNSERAQTNKITAERESTLADAAKKWQEMADAAKAETLHEVEERCGRCETELQAVVGVLGLVMKRIAPVLPQLVGVDPVAIADLNAALKVGERQLWRHSSDLD
jgi:hypothetical protein